MIRDSQMRSLMALTLAMGLLSACEMKQNLDDMHKATVEMSDTTKDMSETTKRMEEKTTELEKKTEALDSKTAELYDALRQGNAAMLRKEFLEQMNLAKEMPKKLSIGVKYFWAYEFQLWSMQGLDDDSRREELAACAAREFIREIHEFAPNSNFISPTTEDNNEKNFLALATTLHEVNDKQKHRVDNKGLSRLSMLSLIERALLQKSEMDAGKITLDQLAPSSYDLLGFEEKLIQILQARHNFILTMLVAKTSNVDKDWKNKIKLGLLGMKWNVDFSKYNDVEMAELKKYANAVLETRALLVRSGHGIEADETITKILKNGQVTKSKSVNILRQTTETEIVNLLNQIKAAPVLLK